MPIRYTLLGVLVLSCLGALHWSPARADSVSYSGIQTATEQNARLSDFDRRYLELARGRYAKEPVSLIMDAIRRAQGPEPYYRRPVSADQIKELQGRILQETGKNWPLEKVTAAVDYTHAHMRESRASNALEVKRKLQRDSTMDRKAFHGQVAEIPEARARKMLLTKDTRSQTYDLTEARPRPRSLQLKFVQSPSAGLRELQADLANANPRARHGVMDRQAVEQLQRSGKLRTIGMAGGQGVYQTTVGPRITVLPSRAFDSTLNSQHYARVGRATVAAMGRHASYYRYATDGLAIAGLVVTPLILYEAYGHGHEAYSLLLDSSTRGTALPYMYLALSVGHTAEAATLLWMAGSEFAVLGLETLTLFELAAGEVFLPIAVVVQSLKFGIAFYEFSEGRIDVEQFRDRATGPALFVTFTTAGAAVCSFVPVAGTITCAIGGAILSVPVSMWDRYYRAEKREAFDRQLFHIKLNAQEASIAVEARQLAL